MFLRNCWYVAGFPEEANRTPFSRKILGTTILFYRTEVGEAVAVTGHCPHRFAPLDKGTLVGDAIQCAYHGLRFSPTGACVGLPSGDQAPPRARLDSYPLIERHGLLWIWMGEAGRADPSAIPDFAFLEDPDCGWINVYLHVKANYQLVTDNLLDLSHGEFLHPMLAAAGWQTRNEQVMRQDGDTITVDNVAVDDPIIPLLRQLRPDLGTVGRWHQVERWDTPANMVLNFELSNEHGSIRIPNGHFVTPETATTSHYMVRGGHYEHKDDAEYAARYKAGVTAIFGDEDVPMLESQQEFLQGDDLLDRHPAILRSDGPAIRARRLLAKRIREEQDSNAAMSSVA